MIWRRLSRKRLWTLSSGRWCCWWGVGWEVRAPPSRRACPVVWGAWMEVSDVCHLVPVWSLFVTELVVSDLVRRMSCGGYLNVERCLRRGGTFGMVVSVVLEVVPFSSVPPGRQGRQAGLT